MTTNKESLRGALDLIPGTLNREAGAESEPAQLLDMDDEEAQAVIEGLAAVARAATAAAGNVLQVRHKAPAERPARLCEAVDLGELAEEVRELGRHLMVISIGQQSPDIVYEFKREEVEELEGVLAQLLMATGGVFQFLTDSTARRRYEIISEPERETAAVS